MHGEVIGIKLQSRIHAVAEILESFACKPRDQIHIYVETVLSRKRELIDNILRRVLSANLCERFIVKRLRIYADSRNSLFF